MLKLAAFAIVSVGIIFVSWQHLRKLRSHGFFRFFAFELILVLFLLNADYWVREPFSAFQIVSWVLLAISFIMVVDGFYLLRTAGNPRGGIDNTTILVKRGVYKYIRHPLYSSLLFLSWGVFLKNPSFVSTALVVVVSAFLIATAKAEEKENVKKFGTDYVAYMKTTKMFIPFLM
jgi:protein-S-isoprenylcysteine O-methyltransferase Ste14